MSKRQKLKVIIPAATIAVAIPTSFGVYRLLDNTAEAEEEQ